MERTLRISSESVNSEPSTNVDAEAPSSTATSATNQQITTSSVATKATLAPTTAPASSGASGRLDANRNPPLTTTARTGFVAEGKREKRDSEKAPSSEAILEELNRSEEELSPDQKKSLVSLLGYLYEVNGQDAYSIESASLGKVTVTEHLILPIGLAIPATDPSEIGAPFDTRMINPINLAQIYALNKAVCPATDEVTRVKFGLLRLEAVKLGWVQTSFQTQIKYVKTDPNALKTFLTDLDKNKDLIPLARTAAFIVPFMNEIMFRTTGHHYLTGIGSDYNANYKKLFDASLESGLYNFIEPGLFFHSAFHWITPNVIYSALIGIMTVYPGRIPEAIAIRANAAPAGMAIITTTAAVLDAMKATDLYEKILAASKMRLNDIIDLANDIRRTPTLFHKSYFAYGNPKLDGDTLRRVTEVSKIASRFAPVAQGFINTMFRGAALERAKALRKHAEANPLQLRASERFFRTLARQEPAKLEDLFSTAEEPDD